jgi:phenylalanyl-tRNA synthetase beta chain
VETGRERALALFDKLGAGKVCDAKVDAGVTIPDKKVITTTAQRICDLIGIEINVKVMTEILTNLGIEVVEKNGVMDCTIPLYREDIDNYTDLAEEVIRYYGYDNITSSFITFAHPTVGGMSARQKNVENLKDIMVSYGAYEALTYSFITPKQYDLLGYDKDSDMRKCIPILNPLSEELSVMRTQLVGSMLNSVYVNLSRRNNNFRLFEIAKAYIPESLPVTKLPKENETLSFAFVGENEDFYQAKEVVSAVLDSLGIAYKYERSKIQYLHPGISADIIDSEGEIIGSFGKLHPKTADAFKIEGNVFVGEITLEKYVENEKKIKKFSALPKFQVIDRDIAMVIDEEITIGEIIKTIKTAGGTWCDSVELFDVYRGSQIEKGKKSVAFKIYIRCDEKTLVDAEIQEFMNNIINSLTNNYNAQLRS